MNFATDSVEIGPELAEFGPDIWAMPGMCCSKLVNCRTDLAEFGTHLVEFGPNLVSTEPLRRGIKQIWAKFDR